VVLLQASIAIDNKIGLICNQEVLTTNIFTAKVGPSKDFCICNTLSMGKVFKIK